MLSVILTILKIIGIILLVVLGLVLSILLVVLFVPVRYKSEGFFKKNEDGFEDNIQFRITWLLHIVSVRFSVKGKDTEFIIRLFGKRLFSNNKESKNEKENISTEIKQKKVDKPVIIESNTDTKNKVETCDVSKDISNDLSIKKDIDSTVNVKLDNKLENKKGNKEDSKIDDENKKSIKDKWSELLEKFNNICQKIKNIKAVKDEFIMYLKKDESKIALKKIKAILFKVLKHVLPKRLKARIKFGFEDPSTTGNILGVASVLYGIYGEKLELQPDFENVVLEGEYKLKGRIRVFPLLVAALKIFFNRWLRSFIRFAKATVKKYRKI